MYNIYDWIKSLLTDLAKAVVSLNEASFVYFVYSQVPNKRGVLIGSGGSKTSKNLISWSVLVNWGIEKWKKIVNMAKMDKG